MGAVITLQPVSPANVAHIVEHYHDKTASSYFYLSSLHGYSRSEIESMAADQPACQFIVRSGAGETLLSLHDLNRAQGHARIQLCVRQDSAGIGAVLGEQMRRLKLKRLYSYVFREERAEQALLSASNFEKEAVFRQHVFMNGAHRDILVYGLVKEAQ